MKQLLLSILMMLLPLLANAETVEINGIYYNLSTETNTAEVTNGPDYYSGDIVIPETVNYEGISYSVTSIGWEAFFRCSGLTSITIPNSVTSIGDYAFGYCSGLTSITIPNSVTSIGDYAFEGCTSLPIIENCLYADTYLVEVVDKTIATCTIKKGTRFIGSGAFAKCFGLTSVTIPDSVTSIGERAFSGCRSLTSVTIGNSVVSIGWSAFHGCSGLASIIIPNSVTTIEGYAFRGCSSLTSITIGSSVTSIGNIVFEDCSNLTFIRVDEGNPVFDSRENCNAIVMTENNELIVGCKNTIIPNSVTSIGESAFESCSSLTSIEIPNSVTSIGVSAFRECIGLTSITIPNSITTIGKHAFFDCSNLTDVSLSEGLISIGEEAFHTCAISTISLPQSLIRIGEQAFQGCRQLTSITLPKNVAYLGNADYIDSYGEMQEEDDLYGDVFNGCDLLADVKVDEQNQAYASVEGLLMTKDMKTLLYIPGAKTEVVVPEGTETIHSEALSSDNLTTITLPKSLKNIEDNALSTDILTSIISKNENPTPISNYAFYYITYNNATLYVPIGTKSKYETIDGWKNFKNIVEMGSNSPIDFADATVKSICVEHWDTNGDGMLSYEEAAAVTDLGSAFSNNKEITSFDELQYFTGLTSIGEGAFAGCRSLTSVTIGNSVTSIGFHAFSSCSNLTSVTIGSSVTSIGNYVFEDCSNLTFIRVDEGNPVFDSRENCNAIVMTENNELIVGCSNTIIPNSVTSIGGYAFAECDSLTSIIIPNSVTSIGGHAFEDCDRLTSITIPNSVTVIEECVFEGCLRLVDVTLPEGLTSIGKEAFSYCGFSTISLPQSLIRIGKLAFEGSPLTTITLPKNVAYLGNADKVGSNGEIIEEDDLYDDVFNYCDLLTEVKVDELNQVYTSVNGLLMTKDMKTLLCIPGAKTEVVVPEGTETIHSGASSTKNLTTITLPKSLKNIEEYGLSKGQYTSIISKNENPTPISNNAFWDNTYNNATLYVPIGTKSKYETTDGWKRFKNIVEMGSNSPIDFADATVKAICVKHWDTNGDGMLSYDEAAAVTDLGSAFSYNKEITSFDELKYFTGLTSIGEETFCDCSGLTSISVPRNVTSIGDRAFSFCTRLKAVNISDIAAWCNISFSGDYSNPSVIMMESNPLSYAHHLYLNGEEVKDLVIPNGVTSIGDYAFWKCYGFISVTIPNSVTTIGCGAFRECKGIISITIPNNLISVEDYAFWHCNGLKAVNISDITTWCNISFNDEYSNPLCHARHLFLNGTEINDLVIPNSVASIGSWAFVNCLGLTSISIPNSVTSIEEGAFSGCRSLTSISIPGNVTTIGSNAFYDCSGLTSVTISNGLSTIGESAFQGCSDLTSISIPSSVTSIGKGAFSWCNNITTIKVDNGNIIYDSRNNCNAIIKTTDNELIVGCKSTVIPESVTSIGSYAFAGCRGLTSDIIPNNVTYIGEGAFAGCSGLTSITIPSSMTIIERGTFSGCSGLTSVTIPNSVTYIGELAFSDCSSLTSVVIPNSVIYIEDAAFSRCSGIISLTISNNVYAIGVSAFAQCSGLTSITIPKSVGCIGEGAFYWCSGLTSVTSLLDMPFPIGNYVFEGCDNATLYVPVGTKSKYETIDGWKNFKNIVEMDLLPVDNGQTIDFGTDIDENTNLNGNIMDNVFVNVNNGDGSYDPSEGCIIVSKPTDDSAIDGKEIFGEDFKDNYTGIVFKLAPGEGTIKVEAQTTGNMVLKVKIGDGMPITMELEGKLKVSFPYNVSEDTYVYIYGGLNTSNSAKGMRRAEPADGTLKIYGIEVDSKANDIESLEVSQDDIATIYNLNGHRINSLQRGVNIIRMNDGTVRKVVVK